MKKIMYMLMGIIILSIVGEIILLYGFIIPFIIYGLDISLFWFAYILSYIFICFLGIGCLIRIRRM